MTRFGSASARLLVNVNRKIAVASKTPTANDTGNRGGRAIRHECIEKSYL